MSAKTFDSSLLQQDLQFNLPRWMLMMVLLELASSAIIPADALLHYILFVSIPTGIVSGLAAGALFTLLQNAWNKHRRPVKRVVNAITASAVVSAAALLIFFNLGSQS